MKIRYLLAKKADEMLDNNEFDLIIDLRDRESYEEINIDNSINIPMNEIGDKMEFLNDYKEKKILLYCGIGRKSSSTSKVLAIYGFKKIYTLKDGLNDYISYVND